MEVVFIYHPIDLFDHVVTFSYTKTCFRLLLVKTTF